MKSTKLERLEEKFNLASEIIEDLDNLVEDLNLEKGLPIEFESKDLVEIKNEELLNINQLKADFQLIRQNVMSVVAAGNKILKDVGTLDLGDLKASQLQALAQLQTALGMNIRLMMDIWKDLCVIEKSREKKNSVTPEQGVNVINGNVNNTQVLFQGSSSELLKLINETTTKNY